MVGFYFLIDRIQNFDLVKYSFFPVLYSFIVIDYFVNGGFWGIVPLDLAVFFMFTACLYNKKWFWIFISADVLMLAVFLYIHFVHPEWAPDLRPKKLMILNLLNIFSRVFILTCFGKIIKDQYEQKINEILHLYSKLRNLNELISSQKEKIQATNVSLKALVNKKLAEYSLVNSHRVRGPLARIIGLNKVIRMHYEKQGNPSDPEMELFLDYLNSCATELDQVIFDINESLKKENFKKIN